MLDWNTNYWDAKTPKVHAPEPKARVPKPVPESDRLFTIQRHALDMLHLLRELEPLIRDHKDRNASRVFQRLEGKAENTYKVINTYLKNHVAPSQGGQF